MENEKKSEAKEITISFETDLEDLLETIRIQFPGVPLDQIGILPDYDRDQGCDEIKAKITIFRKKP